MEGDCALTPLRSLASSPGSSADMLTCLVLEAAEEGSPVLVFCASRKTTQTCALALHARLQEAGSSKVLQEKQSEREVLVTEMRDAMAGFANLELERVMQSGMWSSFPSSKCFAHVSRA